jgi:hypothetical protein
MKLILILRHGKSSWKHPDVNDRRKRDAPYMGELLQDSLPLATMLLRQTQEYYNRSF